MPIDHTDIARTHPGSYHYTVIICRLANELERVGDAASLGTLKTISNFVNFSIGSDLGWFVALENNVVFMNSHSRHLRWAMREFIYKAHLSTDAGNKAELQADSVLIHAAINAL